MAEKFPIDDKQNLMKKDENSVEDLIQFSHSKSNSENEKQVSDKQTFKPSSLHTAAIGFGADNGQQQSTACTRPKLPTHTNQTIYQPNLALSCPGIVGRKTTSRYVTTQSSDTNADLRINSAHEKEHRQSATDMTPDLKVQTRYHLNQDRQSKIKLPKNPSYETHKDRVSSFKLWPIQIKQSKEEMTEAGLYYTGSDDSVRCFQCGGEIRGWEANDNVWAEHARLFPLCLHVRICKGDEFITRVQARIDDDDDMCDRRKSKNSFKVIEDKTLGMGFTKFNFLCAYRHLTNTGNSSPTLEEIVDALC